MYVSQQGYNCQVFQWSGLHYSYVKLTQESEVFHRHTKFEESGAVWYNTAYIKI